MDESEEISENNQIWFKKYHMPLIICGLSFFMNTVATIATSEYNPKLLILDIEKLSPSLFFSLWFMLKYYSLM